MMQENYLLLQNTPPGQEPPMFDPALIRHTDEEIVNIDGKGLFLASQAPPPTEAELAAAQIAETQAELEALDDKYFTPRVLANLPFGDEYALAQKKQHEAEAEPLRVAKRELEATLTGETA